MLKDVVLQHLFIIKNRIIRIFGRGGSAFIGVVETAKGHFCYVPGCWERVICPISGYFLKKKDILRKWIHLIGRKDLPINEETRV